MSAGHWRQTSKVKRLSPMPSSTLHAFSGQCRSP
nr:MAG TPA_asm: hypothetical protein [Caudoviricetes sp.]